MVQKTSILINSASVSNKRSISTNKSRSSYDVLQCSSNSQILRKNMDDRGILQPPEWNQRGSMDDRTNNLVESYNNQVNKKLKTKPNVFRFCDFKIKEDNIMHIAILQSENEPYYIQKQSKDVS